MIDLAAMLADALRPYDAHRHNCLTAALAAFPDRGDAARVSEWWHGMPHDERLALEAERIFEHVFYEMAVRLRLQLDAPGTGLALVRQPHGADAIGAFDGVHFWCRGARGIVRVHSSRIAATCPLY